LLGVIACWWRDIVRESTFEGNHTTLVQTSLKYGMVLFIISEVMFFFSIFWAYFHSSLAPVPEIGSIWPPLGVESIYAWGIPLLNTILLLSSGATVTWAHHALLTGNKNQTLTAMYYSIGLATVFTLIQFFEYIESTFSMSDGVYGSTFFMATGFHGFHVIIGTVFLAITTIRIFGNQMTKEHHFGFEAAIWYWHFVDVVWLFLFVTIYWWGG
jgi:cytochrome c oxidase subunit 3